MFFTRFQNTTVFGFQVTRNPGVFGAAYFQVRTTRDKSMSPPPNLQNEHLPIDTDSSKRRTTYTYFDMHNSSRAIGAAKWFPKSLVLFVFDARGWEERGGVLHYTYLAYYTSTCTLREIPQGGEIP